MATIALTPGQTDVVTLGNAGIAQEYTAKNCSDITVLFVTNDGEYKNAGTDGVAIGADFQRLPADSVFSIDLNRTEHGADRTFYLAGAVNSTVVHVTAHAKS